MSVSLSCHSGGNLQESIHVMNSFCKDPRLYLSNNDLCSNNAIAEPEHLFKRLRMIWCQLEDIIVESRLPPDFDSFCQNNEILRALKDCLATCADPISNGTKDSLQNQIKLLRRSVIHLSELGDVGLCKLSAHALKKENSGVYQYFHTYLNLQWDLIVLEYCLCDYSNEVRNHVTQLVKDLTVLSHSKYNKIALQQSESSPFLCPCVKTLWICIQIFLDRQSNGEFWAIFNKVVGETDPVFSLWFIHHISMLQGYDETGNFLGPACKRVVPNQDFIETQFKRLFTSDDNKNEIVKYCLMNVEPLINSWWCSQIKVTIFQLLWENFYKNLSFLSEEDMPKKARNILTTIESLCSDPCSAKTAFQLFIGMLAKYLIKNGTLWPKLKGRIYSRLPVKKSSSLNDSALYNVYLLFACLAPVEFEELTGRISGMLENLPQERQCSVFAWNLYCALIILYLRSNKPVHSIGKDLICLVQESVKSRDSFDLIKHFILNLEDIMKASSTYMLGQFVFLDSWIKKYLQHCHVTDVDTLLKILVDVVDNVYKSDVWSDWDPVFQIHIFPCLKQLATTNNASPRIGQLAAALCKVSPELSNQGMAYFTDDPVDPGVSARFALTLVQNQLIPNQEGCIIKAWLRCCLLSTENNEELTKSVLKLHNSIASFKNKLETSSNPLFDMFELLAQENNIVLKETVLKLLVDNLTNVDVWVKPYIKEPKSEALTIHIYTNIAVLVYNFAPILYNKTKSACLLSRIISTFLLPVELLRGQTPHNYVLHSVQRTWHLYFKGIYALNWNDDLFLERTLKDLIVCYVPHFPTDNSPLLKCFNDENMATVILQKIAIAFLSHSSKCTKQHSLKVLRFFDNFMNNCKSVGIMRFIAQSVLVILLEFLLFNLHCNAAVSTLISLTSSDFYDAVKSDVHQSIITVTEKHLTFNSNNYFQLALILVKIIPDDIKVLLPKIHQIVVSVEKVRGDGFDSTLRKGLSSIEAAVSV